MSESVSESVTRSPIELFWTPKTQYMRWSIFSSRFQLLNVKIDKTNPASNPLEIYEIILYEKKQTFVFCDDKNI